LHLSHRLSLWGRWGLTLLTQGHLWSRLLLLDQDFLLLRMFLWDLTLLLHRFRLLTLWGRIDRLHR